MASQFFVINQTRCKILLKTHKLKWIIGCDRAYSLSLPNDANHTLKYKIKHDGKLIAKLWMDHNGQIIGIKNKSGRFYVMMDDSNHHSDLPQYSDGSAPYPHAHKPVHLIIKHTQY